MSRAVIIHGHIFKNAGTTLDWALERNFGDGFLDHRDNIPMREGKQEYLLSIFRENQHLLALSSHHLPLPLAETPDFDFFPIVLLRHPIERARSAYRFERQQDSDSPGARMAKELDFSSYVKWRMDPKVGGTIRNNQVHYCGGWITGPKFPPLEEIYRLASRFVAENPCVGLVERFDESMVLFEESLRPAFPGIDLTYVKQNVTESHRKEPLVAKLEKIRQEIGDDTYDLLVRKNSYDLKLYDQVKSLFDMRFKTLGRCDERLKKFRNRCQTMEPT